MSKRYQHRVIAVFMMVLALFSLSAVAAQDSLDEQPLLQMLTRIPYTTLSRTEIFYNDRKAVETAYPDTRMPADVVEFGAANAAKGEDPDLLPVELWWRAWRNQATAFSARNMQGAAETLNTVGFDIFQVEQEMTYGTPPAQTLQLMGNFNLDTVRAAFTLRDYSLQTGDNAELWCPEAGCDVGLIQNLPNRNPANPFGGEFGRSQSLLIEDGALISSPNGTVMNDHVDVVNGDEQSLADLPQYRAVTAALTADGSLLQAYIWDGELLAQMSQLSPTSILGERATPERVKQMLQELLKDYENLPVYQLLAFADVASETEQIGQVALVYTNEADAKTAAGVLPERIANYQSIVAKQPFMQLLNDRRVVAPVVKVVAVEGVYVVVAAFPTPKATGDDLLNFTPTSDIRPDVTPPGLVFKLLLDSAYRRDLGWLSTVPRSVIEESAK